MNHRPVAVIGAPSSIGIRPYDDGQARHLDRAPSVLRERGLITRLGASDMGDVMPPPYRDYVRPHNRPRNEEQVITYSRSLGERVRAATRSGRFALVLGGDCSIVLGCLLGARQARTGFPTGGASLSGPREARLKASHHSSRHSPVGLVYLDAHADFATPEESRTGSAAGMCLGLALGRGDTPLARLGGRTPLVDGRNVALVGRRDAGEPWYGHAALRASRVLDLPDRDLMTEAFVDVAEIVLGRVARPGVRGFWIHLDADVLNPAVMPAVDSPEPGGPMPNELVSLLTPLVRHPLALGMSVAIYDPALDPDRSCARQLVGLLETVLAQSNARPRSASHLVA